MSRNFPYVSSFFFLLIFQQIIKINLARIFSLWHFPTRLRLEIGLENFGASMSATKRFPTGYPGVFYREVRRLGKNGTEKVYYVVYKKDGKISEEKVGLTPSPKTGPLKS